MATEPTFSDAEADAATKAAKTHEVVRIMMETSRWEREREGYNVDQPLVYGRNENRNGERSA
jgi:hypothetical protein